MTIRESILIALGACSQPVGGREVAALAGQAYKPVIDALNRMLDMGRVYRQGRTHTAKWTTTPPDDPALDAARALDLAWFGPARHRAGRTARRDGGGMPEGTTRARNNLNDPTRKKFSAAD